MSTSTGRDLPDGQVRIRAVRADDVEAVYAMRVQASSVTYTTALPSNRIEETRRFLDGLGGDDHVLVAELGFDGSVVGMAGLHVGRGKQRHIADLGIMVHEAYQGRGIGRALLDALLAIADDHLGLIRVELEVLPDNPVAIALYERCGFEHEGRRRLAYHRNGAYGDALRMGRLRLPAVRSDTDEA